MQPETVLVSSAPTASSSSLGSLSLHDITTGTSLFNLKQTGAASNGLAFVEHGNGQAGTIFTVVDSKAILNVWNFQKDQLILKIILPEKMSCIAVDKYGHYVATGSDKGRIYLWEVASGTLFNAFEAHYRKVSTIKFTHCGSALVTGSDDSSIHVWELSRLVDIQMQNELAVPFCSFGGHTLRVTDLVVGIGRFPTCRILSSSIDRTAKLWDLSSQTLLKTYVFPLPIGRIVMDTTERLFFAAAHSEFGTADSLEKGKEKEGQQSDVNGTAYRFDLYRKKTDSLGRTVVEGLAGEGNDLVRHTVDESDVVNSKLISTVAPITSMALSLTGTHLICGLANGQVNIYDVATHQPISTIAAPMHKGSSIAFVGTLFKPPDLLGHVTMDVASKAKEDETWLPRHVSNFQRIRHTGDGFDREVTVLLRHKEPPPAMLFDPDEVHKQILDEQAFFLNEFSSNASNGVFDGTQQNSETVSQLEAEVAKLKTELSRAKALNDAMWEGVEDLVRGSKLQTDGRDSSMADPESGDGDSSRKRMRT